LKCQLSLSNSLILNLLFTIFIVLHPHLKNLELLLLQFLEDFQTLVSVVSTTPHDFLITGDFNIHGDNPSDSSAIQFLTLLDHANLTQHDTFPTHIHSHTLDLVITAADSSLSPSVTYSPVSPSDHFPVIYSLNTTPLPYISPSKHFTRFIHSINVQSFIRDIISSRTHTPTYQPNCSC